MRLVLSLSSLALGRREFDDSTRLLHKYGIEGVELAPTAVWGSRCRPTALQLSSERGRWEREGITIGSIQSILYGSPELQLFDKDTQPLLATRLIEMADIASGLGATHMVFGSPRNRLRKSLNRETATRIAVDFFGDLVADLRERNVVLTLEPNPPLYGADFMISYSEVLDVVNSVGSAQIASQIDTGCVTLAGEDPAGCVHRRVPGHVHISAPGIGELPGDHGIDWGEFRVALAEEGYAGHLNIEILPDRLSSPAQLDDSLGWASMFFGAVGGR